MNPSIPFQEFPKIARLNREVIVTEKIDGTNSCIYIPEVGTADYRYRDGGTCEIFVGSRTKWITPGADNHGFARWVEANRDDLLTLGPGRHFGEWWGSGIQRGYGLKKGEKRFSLYNTHRWGDDGVDKRPACCSVVPVLWRGNFDDLVKKDVGEPLNQLEWALYLLKTQGSVAAPGFMRPEGVVIYHSAANMCFKKTIERDDQPKGTGVLLPGGTVV